jgi:hypothetical protein
LKINNKKLFAVHIQFIIKSTNHHHKISGSSNDNLGGTELDTSSAIPLSSTHPNHHNKQIKEVVTIRESFRLVENIKSISFLKLM